MKLPVCYLLGTVGEKEKDNKCLPDAGRPAHGGNSSSKCHPNVPMKISCSCRLVSRMRTFRRPPPGQPNGAYHPPGKLLRESPARRTLLLVLFDYAQTTNTKPAPPVENRSINEDYVDRSSETIRLWGYPMPSCQRQLGGPAPDRRFAQQKQRSARCVAEFLNSPAFSRPLPCPLFA
ncbi:hypothetical protein BIW11_04840 [Tropilaelaps mercedesae]|uniref:Uncharacterized protein n=1 Tax=Tropilaelaps mercedesae TaxID=418985 RepID=A0A1V9X0X6_9ACAR|nr:hypothetical protein BIW11_04840 [Tropilaelaps mercedesae]